MVGARIYDLMYRVWAPWDSAGVRGDLVGVLESGVVDAERFPRSIDLGCGTGANVVYLAQQGFDAHGVDFSIVAIRKARERAEHAGVSANFVVADLTSEEMPGIEGPFDFLLDFGTLDDLRGDARRAMAQTITRLSRPGSKFFEYCFHGVTEDLPRISFSGTSRMSHIAPGELEALFGADWEVEPVTEYAKWRIATFLLTRKG